MNVQYKIIGGDEVEYGPATLAELKDWIRDGRVAGMTKVWRSDLAMWARADRYTELFEDLARLHESALAAASRTAPPAGFWARLAAWVIDMILLTILFAVVWTPIAEPRHWQLPDPPQTITPATVQAYQDQFYACAYRVLPIFYPIFLLYDVLLNGRFGATVGKMAIGAKITMLDGSPIGYGRALLRWLAQRLSDFLFISYILIGLRRDKRSLHDLLAGTKVVFRR